MKKLLSLVMIATMMVGCANNVDSMKDIQEEKGMDYNVIEVSNTLFLIEYDDVIYAMENNEKIGEVAYIIESEDNIQIIFIDGASYWVEK